MSQAAIRFYHLTRSPYARAVGALCEKCLGQGWQVLVTSADQSRLTDLDEALWLGPEDRFLAHGLAGTGWDARQPVLLSTETAAASDRQAVLAVLPAALDPALASAVERVFILFDGADEAAIGAARGLWRATLAAGIAAEYYSEESGGWALTRRSDA